MYPPTTHPPVREMKFEDGREHIAKWSGIFDAGNSPIDKEMFSSRACLPPYPKCSSFPPAFLILTDFSARRAAVARKAGTQIHPQSLVALRLGTVQLTFLPKNDRVAARPQVRHAPGSKRLPHCQTGDPHCRVYRCTVGQDVEVIMLLHAIEEHEYDQGLLVRGSAPSLHLHGCMFAHIFSRFPRSFFVKSAVAEHSFAVYIAGTD